MATLLLQATETFRIGGSGNETRLYIPDLPGGQMEVTSFNRPFLAFGIRRGWLDYGTLLIVHYNILYFVRSSPLCNFHPILQIIWLCLSSMSLLMQGPPISY